VIRVYVNRLVQGKLLKFNCSYPLSAAGEERVVDPPIGGNDRVSQTRQTLPQMHWRQCPPGLTHPEYATLLDPLFHFAGKRVKKITII